MLLAARVVQQAARSEAEGQRPALPDTCCIDAVVATGALAATVLLTLHIFTVPPLARTRAGPCRCHQHPPGSTEHWCRASAPSWNSQQRRCCQAGQSTGQQLALSTAGSHLGGSKTGCHDSTQDHARSPAWQTSSLMQVLSAAAAEEEQEAAGAA